LDDPTFPRPIRVSAGVTVFDLEEADQYITAYRPKAAHKSASRRSAKSAHNLPTSRA
jgi:hypothetical protein